MAKRETGTPTRPALITPEPVLHVITTYRALLYAGILAQNWFLTDLYGSCWLATATKTKRSELISERFAQQLSTVAEKYTHLDVNNKIEIITHVQTTEGFISGLEISEAKIYILLPPNASNLKDLHLLATPITNRKYGAAPEVYEHLNSQIKPFLDGARARCCYFGESVANDYYISILPPTDSTFGEFQLSNDIYSYSAETYRAAELGFENLYGLEIPSAASPKWITFRKPKGR